MSLKKIRNYFKLKNQTIEDNSVVVTRLSSKVKRGFTLIELVVVIAVIAVLAVVSVAAYFGVTDSAEKSKVEQELDVVENLWTQYIVDPNSGFYELESNNPRGLYFVSEIVENQNGLDINLFYNSNSEASD